MLFHPTTLELLAAHKRSGSSVPPLALLALLTDNTAFIGFDALFEILFSHTGCGDPEAVRQQLSTHARAAVCDGGVRCLWPCLPSAVRSLLANTRSQPPRAVGALPAPNFVETLAKAVDGDFEGPGLHEEPAPGSLTPKRRRKEAARQRGTLPFASTGRAPVAKIDKFAPLEPKNATFVYDRTKIVFDTQRKRDDLVSPQRLQFIHHFDQRRPPIYRRRPALAPSIHSFRPIPAVASYDSCSSEEWAEALEARSSSTPSESEESSGTTDSDCVAPDSDTETPLEATRYTKKPTFHYEDVPVRVFFEEGRFRDAFLEESDVAPEALIPTLRALLASDADLQLVSQLYGIRLSALQDVCGRAAK